LLPRAPRWWTCQRRLCHQHRVVRSHLPHMSLQNGNERKFASVTSPRSASCAISRILGPTNVREKRGPHFLARLNPYFKLPSGCTDVYRFDTTVLDQPAWYTTLYTGGCAMNSCCPFFEIYTTAYGWYSSYYSSTVCPQNYITCTGPREARSGLPRNEHVCFCCPRYVWLSIPKHGVVLMDYQRICLPNVVGL
jgi:hypothetical protein